MFGSENWRRMCCLEKKSGCWRGSIIGVKVFDSPIHLRRPAVGASPNVTGLVSHSA